MTKRFKWITNGVSFNRGNYEDLIAKFDNSRKWLKVGAYCTTSSFKSSIRNLAEVFGASVIEIKPLWDENEQPTEDRTNVVNYRKLSDGYWFYIPKQVPEGAKQEFIEFTPEEIFTF